MSREVTRIRMDANRQALETTEPRKNRIYSKFLNILLKNGANIDEIFL